MAPILTVVFYRRILPPAFSLTASKLSNCFAYLSIATTSGSSPNPPRQLWSKITALSRFSSKKFKPGHLLAFDYHLFLKHPLRPHPQILFIFVHHQLLQRLTVPRHPYNLIYMSLKVLILPWFHFHK